VAAVLPLLGLAPLELALTGLAAGVWAGQDAAQAAETPGAHTSIIRSLATSGGGAMGSGNPMRVVSLIGQPIGGAMAGPGVSVQDPVTMAPPETTPTPPPPDPVVSPSETTPPPPDTTPPSGVMTINGGAPRTNSRQVTVTFVASDDSGRVTRIRCAHDASSFEPPTAYAAVMEMTLSEGDGPKRVTAQFGDAGGNWSEPVSAVITLDTTPPSITVTTPRDGEWLGRSPP
jgi:hypothetical protein